MTVPSIQTTTSGMINNKIQVSFLLLAIAQGLHSIEEAIGKLWDVYPPATYLSGLVSDNLKTGFIIINISLFIVLMLTWLGTFSKTFSVKGLLWFWTIMEMINASGHFIWAIAERSYEPGLVTAPLLLFLAIRLSRLLIRGGTTSNRL